jgi:hypothetical protein
MDQQRAEIRVADQVAVVVSGVKDLERLLGTA